MLTNKQNLLTKSKMNDKMDNDTKYLISQLEKLHVYSFRGGPDGPERFHTANCWVCKLLNDMPSRKKAQCINK